MGHGVPDHVEKEFRSYLKCGILAHGFGRARCPCGHEFLVAFSCRGQGCCPSCGARRMAQTAAHMVDHVFPRVPALAHDLLRSLSLHQAVQDGVLFLLRDSVLVCHGVCPFKTRNLHHGHLHSLPHTPAGRSDQVLYRLPGPDPSGRAALLARIYKVFPLVCPTCQAPLTFIAFFTDPEPITQILAHFGEPTSPPLIHPARGPPQTDLDMGPAGGQAEEVAQESYPDYLDQSPEFDPEEPEPIPEDDFDQSRRA